jgi:hypothetical protein
MNEIPGIVRYAKGATQAQLDEAKAILEALDFAYPNHPWSVEISGDETGGRVFIRHLAFEGRPYGMNLKHTKKDTAFYSSSAFKRAVILKAGEWLERAGLTRSRYDPERPLQRKVDGVPSPKSLEMDVVISTSARELRSEPRPQVEKLKEQNDEMAGPV